MQYQSTLNEPERFRPLSTGQRKVLALLNAGLTQTYIAQKLHLTRPRINQLVKGLESLGLINRVQNNRKCEGVRDYSYFYELTSRAKAIIAGDCQLEELTPWRVHNHRMKWHVIQQTGEICKDKRTGYQKSWTLRGGERHKYWWHSNINYPSVTIDVHPKTLVVYTDKGQQINAKTKEEAAEMGWIACRKAVAWFMETQAGFDSFFTLEEVGQQIGKLHLGMAFHEDGPIDGDTTIPGTWVDRSVEKELGPGWKEFECWENHPISSPLEAGVMAAAKIPDALKQFNDQLSPIGENVTQVMAMLQGSITQQQMLENVTKLVSSLMVEVQAMRTENQELKRRLGIV